MKNSQAYTLLESFKSGSTLTAKSAFIQFGIAPFSQRINDIERMGYTIAMAWVTAPNANALCSIGWLNEIR